MGEIQIYLVRRGEQKRHQTFDDILWNQPSSITERDEHVHCPRVCNCYRVVFLFLNKITTQFSPLLFFSSPHPTTNAGRYATAMMLLEEQSVRKIRDLRQGGDQSLITCFAKRAPCNCMKEKYEEAKKMPKQGKCDGCKQITERRNLQLCACKVDQYCSAKCQRESWAEHKQYCEAIRSGEAEVSFIYS